MLCAGGMRTSQVMRTGTFCVRPETVEVELCEVAVALRGCVLDLVVCECVIVARVEAS